MVGRPASYVSIVIDKILLAAIELKLVTINCHGFVFIVL